MSIIDEKFDEYILKGQEILRDPRINSLVMQFVKSHFHHKTNYEVIENKLNEILKDVRLDSSTKWRRMFTELANCDSNNNVKNKNERNKHSTAELCSMDILSLIHI